MIDASIQLPRINPRFKSIIPPLTEEEFGQLRANLLVDGCRDPLVTWDNDLLDGHNRLEICREFGIPFKTVPVNMKLDSEDDAITWIIFNQFGRRNLSPFSRAELALRLEAIIKPKAKEKQREAGGAVRQKSDKAPVDTKKVVAKAANLSHDTISKAKVIAARASEETKASLRSGETSINAEYRKLTVHVGQNSGENEWYTPKKFIEAAKEAMGSLDLDPASSATANKTVQAAEFFTAEQNGLKQKWHGQVWLNPPYSQPLISKFAEAVAEKFAAGEITQACVLVNNATETGWFGKIAAQASAICFPEARIKFLDPSGKASGAPLQGQAVLYLGKRTTAFIHAFRQLGIICRVEH